MYDASADPYTYEGTTVLRNLAGIRDQEALDRFEAAMTSQRADEPLPRGRFGAAHYRAVHRHLFQDVFTWAGKYRIVRIAKEGSAFCYPENIAREMEQLFRDLRRRDLLRNMSVTEFAEQGAGFLSTLNAIHPFREGNGRTQTTFFALLAAQSGYRLKLDRLEPEPFLAAMVASFKGNDIPLARQILNLASE